MRIAVVGDFCLDRYLEIDPARTETSIETGLPVHNVVNVRAQPGGAGTILNNLVALGIETIFPIGFAGHDGEGYELTRALAAKRGVKLDFFIQTGERCTFTYCKPLIVEAGKSPRELSRLDQKNWSPTPDVLSEQICAALRAVGSAVDGIILLDQVDQPGTGVLTKTVLSAVNELSRHQPSLPILADSRTGLRDFPPVIFKMNAAELSSISGAPPTAAIADIGDIAKSLARKNNRPVFVTLAERGMLASAPDGNVERIPALPVRGEIDIVGAGDAVTANLTAALAAGSALGEAMELATGAASVVIHQLGTTGTASVSQVQSTLFPAKDLPEKTTERD